MSTNEENDDQVVISGDKKSVEERYKSLTELEHVLHRPDMYIGSVVPKEVAIHILNDFNKFESKSLEYTPGILKLIDEVLSNSVDEHGRCKQRREEAEPRQRKHVHMLTKIDVTLTEDGVVTVSDNGGIPVKYHGIEKCYVPQLIFGKLRAGSNFDDSEKRTGIGRNGVGSSLANILATQFAITTCDGDAQYHQVWNDNMKMISDPTITLQARRQYAPNTYPSKEVYTEFGTLQQRPLTVQYVKAEKLPERGTTTVFKIDFSRFPKEDNISYGIMKLVERKCIMAAATNPEITVTFNGASYNFPTFQDYAKMYGYEDVIHGKLGQWEYIIAPTDLFAGGFNYSFVNGAECNIGTHVKHFHGLLRGHLNWYFEKKHKLSFTNDQIQKQYALFLNVSVVNPAYDAQTKEVLITDHNYFHGGETADWPKFETKTFAQLENSKIVKNLLAWNEEQKNSSTAKELAKKNKEMKSKSPRSVAKLDDANAGPKDRHKCDLWTFEGQSAANTFADVRDNEYMASYTLKGKVKNTLNLKPIDIAKNVEFNDIAVATGLRYNRDYNIKDLRFGRIIIAVDADVDGISICAGLITFFHTHFPEIIEAGMLFAVLSPLYKLTKGSGKTASVEYFYSTEEFDKADKRGKAVEYFKGLGSLGVDEYEEMVTNPRLVKFLLDDNSTEAIEDWMGGSSERRKKHLETAAS